MLSGKRPHVSARAWSPAPSLRTVALASLGAFEDHDGTVVLPGHGQPYTDGLVNAVTRARQAGIS